MRRHLLAALSVALLSLANSPAISAEPAENVKTPPRKYVIECRIVDASSGSDQTISRPKIALVEHRKASFRVQVERPFVIAVSPAKDGAHEPIIELVREGRTFEFAYHASGSNHVTLDLAIEETQIVDVEVKKVDDEISIQVPKIEITRLRRFVTGRPGETLIVPLDGKSAADSKRRAEFVVAQLPTE